MYAICKNGRCAQTYLIADIINGRSEEQFNKEIKETDGFKCEKCGAVVVEPDGSAMISQHPHVIPYITVEELEANKKREIKRKRDEIKQLKREIKELEEE